MTITTDSPIYQKAFEQYLRKGTPIEISLKALTERTETRESHSTVLYRWRTAGDDKVRPSHAANEGRIFNWDRAPATGHPGEDYGCRCMAEPVEIDASPLELLALLSGVGIIRSVGVRVGAAILRRIERGRDTPAQPKPAEKPAEPKPARSIEDRPKNIPKDWVKSSTKKDGVQYTDPKDPGNYVRIERADPRSSQPGQRYDYVRWQKNGRALDKNGNAVKAKSLESHVPIEDFNFKPELFK